MTSIQPIWLQMIVDGGPRPRFVTLRRLAFPRLGEDGDVRLLLSDTSVEVLSSWISRVSVALEWVDAFKLVIGAWY